MRTIRMLAIGCAAWLLSGMVWAQAPNLEDMDLVQRSVPNGPVARVIDTEISKEEFLSLYATEIAATQLASRTSELPETVRLQTGVRCVRMLIQREILFQEAKKRKLSVGNEEFEKRWEAELERLRKMVSRGTGKDLSEQELLRRAGATHGDARDQFRKALLIEKMRDQLAKESLDVSEADVAAFYKENKDRFKRPERLHLNQIFVGAHADATALDAAEKKAQARERIEIALKRIQAGESFAAVAKAVSEAPDKDKGGDLGPLPTATLPPPYVEAAASMKPGEISGVIESDMGFHLIQLVEVMEGGGVTLEQAAPRIRKMLLAQKADAAIAEFCDPIAMKPGNVEVYLQLEKTLSTYPEYKKLKAEQAGARE